MVAMRGLWCVVLAVVLLGGSAQAGQLYVGFWNVENLFDTTDDPKLEGDEEFTPTGDKKWDQKRLDHKLKKLSSVIRQMNQKAGPDVLGLCEVENKADIELLLKEVSDLKRSYVIVHQDSPSDRGIDTAIVYDSDRLKLKHAKFHKMPVEGTRDIVEACFEVDSKLLYVFANHWPSRANPEEQRITVAKALRARIDEILKTDPAADIVVLGDLNDYPTSPSVKDHLKAAHQTEEAKEGRLLNTMAKIDQDPKRGTYVYKNRWEVLDHVIVSPGLLEAEGLRWKVDSTSEIFLPEQVYTPKDPAQLPRPSRTFSRNTYHEDGVSDHLPVGCVLEY